MSDLFKQLASYNLSPTQLEFLKKQYEAAFKAHQNGNITASQFQQMMLAQAKAAQQQRPATVNPDAARTKIAEGERDYTKLRLNTAKNLLDEARKYVRRLNVIGQKEREAQEKWLREVELLLGEI